MVSDLDRLRQEVAKRRQAATNKIARTRRNNGAELAGTSHDPRRVPGIERRYNRAQLTVYLGQLNYFMRRPNQFTASAEGPVRKGRMAFYTRLETRNEELNTQHMESLNKLGETPSGMIAQGNKQMMYEGQGASVVGPYRSFKREATDIAGPVALEKLISDMMKRTSAAFLPNKIKAGRENLKTALRTMNEHYKAEDIDKLSDYQFDAFWFGTNVAEAVFMQYHNELDRIAEAAKGEDERLTSKEAWQTAAIQGAIDEFDLYYDWALNFVPKEEPETPLKKKWKQK